jgi:glutamate decarboxylase
MHTAKQGKDQNESTTTYASRYMSHVVPKHHLPAQGMPAAAAKRIILDELNLDGNPALNTASFVTTWMEPEADELLLKTRDINFIDFDEYPTTSAIHQRVVNMMADILNGPEKVEGRNHSAAAM